MNKNKHRIYLLALTSAFVVAVIISLLCWSRDDINFRPQSDSAIHVASRRKTNLAAIEKANGLPVRSPLIINSIGLPDGAGPTDENGYPAPWIEIYNHSDQPIDLKGYRIQCGYPGKYSSFQPRITYSDSDVTTYQKARHCILPALTIAAHSSLFLYADSKCWLPEEHSLTIAENNNWQSGHDYQRTINGYCLFTTNAGANITMATTIKEDGIYTLWLRGYADEKAAPLTYQLDDDAPVTITLPPRKGYDFILLGKPRHLGAGKHTVRLISGGGEIIFSNLFFNNAETPNTSFHLNFRLLPKGDTIAIYPPNGLPLDFVTYPALCPGQTYLRQNNEFQLTTNKPGNLPTAPEPLFSLPSGFISAPTNLIISCPSSISGATISVTFDGSLPQPTNSRSSLQLTITNSSFIRARIFAPGYWPSKTATHVYWTEPPPSIPVVWVVLDPVDLYSSQRGILRNREARSIFSDRPASVHFLFPDGRVKECPIMIRLQGRISRFAVPNFPCRSFRFICQSTAGPNNFGKVFDEPGPTNLTKIIARANNIIYHPFGLEVMRRIGFIAPRYRHCLLQVNNRADKLTRLAHEAPSQFHV